MKIDTAMIPCFTARVARPQVSRSQVSQTPEKAASGAQRWIIWGQSVLLGMGIVGLTPGISSGQTPQNPEIHVGVIQRFGADPEDEIKIEPLAGDRLTLKFETGGQPQTLTTNQVTLDVVMEPLPEPKLQEWVVLSSHRSFESAEDSANQWQARGIETEIAQPDGWQVWAKRDVYDIPLLRRLLLKNLHAEGLKTTFLDSRVVQEEPKAAFVANGYRYHRDRFEILSANRRIRVIAGSEKRDRKLYGGDLRLQPNAYNTYTLVNQVPIETYLRGVVPHEIGLAAPRTTIEAQAILARTYALRNLRRFTIDDYELCADTQCQVYWGLGGSASVTDRAIAATRGQVLTYQNELIDALYSSTTGGVTAAFSHVWNGPDRPYLRPVVDSVQSIWNLTLNPLSDELNLRTFISLDRGFNEVGWARFRWRVDSDLTQITQDLKEYLQNRQHPLANFNRVSTLQVTKRALAGRVQQMTIQTDIGAIQLEKDEVIRALSAPRSLLFYIDPIYQESEPLPTSAGPLGAPTGSPAPNAIPLDPVLKGYAFVGGGLGHGVGMSQTGAYNLGALGWSNERILKFYYPTTELKPISNDIVFWRDPN
ncbi:MAG: SpoIID/LytB domain-containing protein [Leptolyngbyaceae cyanobacterium MO_188.B28]|nr:SpoIID/LytB domain-containing protein [Leptolyngbyaceae cyanobacterium MO_188.B28]